MGKSNRVPPALEVTGERIEGIVLWYSNKRGIGFISVDGYQNIFVHITMVRLAGLSGLREKDKLSFVLACDQHNPGRTFATEIQMIKTSSAAMASRPQRRVQGTLLSFKHDEGYGFIMPDDGGPNVFLGDTAVSENDLPLLQQGLRVSYVVLIGRDDRTRAAHLLIV